jgi:hypothetical protein
MKTGTRNVRCVALFAATLLTFASTSAANEQNKSVAKSAASSDVAASGSKQVIRPAITSTTLDQIDKNVEKLSTSMQKMFKDFRPNCKSQPARRPTSSWPSRGEAAISVCRS